MNCWGNRNQFLKCFWHQRWPLGFRERVQSKTDLSDWDVPKINTTKVGQAFSHYPRRKGMLKAWFKGLMWLNKGFIGRVPATRDRQLLLKPTRNTHTFRPIFVFCSLNLKCPFFNFQLNPPHSQCFNTHLKWIPLWLVEVFLDHFSLPFWQWRFGFI